MDVKFYWHIHHDRLVEATTDIEERIKYIKTHKSDDEQKLRLRLMKEVKGNLPQKYIMTDRQAYEAYAQAHKQVTEAYVQAHKQAHKQVYTPLYTTAYAQAYEAYEAANNQYKQSYEQIYGECKAEIDALHKSECPDCLWDGETIFPKTVQELQ